LKRNAALSRVVPLCITLLAALAPAASAMTAPDSDANIAFGKPVVASGATTGAASLVTDGDAATYTFPTTAGVIGFYYQIDLGQEYPIQQIYLYSQINANPNRLSKVRMSVYSDSGGAPGVERWKYTIRPGGENNVQGSVDVLTGDLDPAGTFRGRFIRITNDGLSTNCPDVAEIEVYEAPKPRVLYFGPDAGNITKTGAPGRPTQAVLSWNVAGYTSLNIDQGIGSVTGPAGSVIVSPNVMTTYTLTATNGAGVTTQTVTIGVDAPEMPPSISEFLASNVGGLEDGEKNRPDWIEVSNPNPFAINLDGYFLTDNPLNKTKWQFPAFTVPGNGYAVVFASNANTPSPPLETPHTNFSLDTSGEYVGLVARDGTTVLSQIPADYPTTPTYPPQKADRSYGFSGAVAGYFATPTPNAANGATYQGIVADTVFSVKRGFYTSTQQVAIACATPGAEVRYTTDGSAPTPTTGTVLPAGSTVPVTATSVLRAAAFKPGWVPTNVDTHTYLFPATLSTAGWLAPSIATDPQYAPLMVDALKQVPSMSFTIGPGVTINGATDTVGALEWIDPAGGPGFHVPCGAKLFGGAFTNFAKKSYRISFRGEYGASKLKFPLFAGFERGLAAVDEFDQIELRNGSHDMVARGFYMSNIFTDATLLDMGAFASHGRFVHLYLNGAYWGLFHLRERWSADMMSAYYGGKDTDYESVNGNLNVGGWADPGLPYDGTDAGWTLLKSLARSGPDTYEKLRPYLDVPQYVDYMIMWMFGKSEDEYRTTGPVGMGHGYKFILNDADGYLYLASYGGPASDRTNRGAPGRSAGDGPGSLFSMLFKDGGADYRTLLADRIHRAFVLPGGAMTPSAAAARLTELCASIDKAIIPECARWNYRTPANWATARDGALNWLTGVTVNGQSTFTTPRATTVLGHYSTAGFYPSTAAPTVNPPPGVVASGTNVAMSSSTGGAVIYYTANGSDPRVPGPVTPNAPLVTTASVGKYRVPTGPNDGITQDSIPNLLAYWPLDTGASDIAGGYHGTLSNGAFINTPGRYGAGCLELDGTNDYVALGDPAGLQITGQITIAAWVKPDATNGLRNIVNKGHDNSTTPNGEITLRINAGAYQTGYWAGSAGSVIAAGPASGANSAAADIGTWHHLAGVWDGATWRLYRDGVQIASAASATGAVTVPTVGWAIGARGTGTERFFDGQIDEVRIYNRGLSALEINSLYNNSATTGVASWAQPGWNDTAWPAAANGIGFAPPGDALLPGVAQDISGPMKGVNASVYLRLPFSLTNSERTQTSQLQLTVRADDGFVAYLNGTRIADRGAPSPLTGASAATAETADTTALAGQTIDLTTNIPALVDGTNVLAIHGLNLTAADDDALVSAELTSFRGTPGVLPGALTYSGSPLTLTQNTIIRTRSYLPGSNSWSPLTEVFYQVGPQACPPGAVVVSELHFNPLGDGDGEFVELLNVSTGAVNLRGAKFTAGIDFTFPANRDSLLAPGERLVLVDSQLTFQRVHGWAENVAGTYHGNLNNGGERITLVAADGVTTILDFTYDGANPWPDIADGGGRSLVLINPRLGIDMNAAANWRPSLADDGAPNLPDGLVFTGSPFADADKDGLSAWAEFALGTSDNVPNVFPMSFGFDALGNPSLTIDYANGADAAAPFAEASTDLSAWTIPVHLAYRNLLPNGGIRSIWTVTPPPSTDRLFFRFRLSPP
jgi:hypothetical protein